MSRIDITPAYSIRLNGFGFRRTESEGVTQSIWIKGLALDDGAHKPAVLLAVDLLGVPDKLVGELAAYLHQRHGIPPERLAVTATHTHTAPMLEGVTPTIFGTPIPAEHQAHIAQYTREVAASLRQAADQALAELRPAKLEWGVGEVKFAKNRRTAGGPVDHDLPVLVVREPEGKVRGIYLNYACHCVTLSHNRISGDWAGYAQEVLEKKYPGATVLVAIGCGADQNPNSGVTGDKLDIALAQGQEIGSEVERLLAGPLQPVSGPLTARQDRFPLAFAPLPDRTHWETLAQRQDAIGHHARVQLERLDRGERLPGELPYSVSSWSFGDTLGMVFLPGEVVVDYALRLKRELDGSRLWVTAYANDAPCYIPSERVLREGGYEGGGAMVYYDQPTALAPGLEQRIVDAVKGQLLPAFAANDEPEKLQGSLPLSPQRSLARLQTDPALRVELVAAEPLVVDPVAIEFGPDGALWVAEMHDYPAGRQGRFEPGGRVRLLRDRDGDGRMDQSTVFLKDIPFPTGITVWRKGVLVCAAPDILYAEDLDGDDRADRVQALYQGFGTGNYQARVNSLEYGLDGWLYGSCGLFGGTIARGPDREPYPLGDRDFRLRPDEGAIEAATGRTQQGRVRNDWGDWFGCDNSTLCRHYPLAEHYLRRNPFVPVAESSVYVPDYPHSNRLFPLKQDAQRFQLSGTVNGVTAACGLGIYRDELLGEEYSGNAFVCEPVNLVVHRMPLAPRGVTFRGSRAAGNEEREFLASTDNWFRPVQVRTGPDGALWVVDMYRFVIEHPRWIPQEDLARLDVRAGASQGRIYRICPRDRPARQWLRLDGFSGEELAGALDSPNGWQRDMATQLLVWRDLKDAAPALRQLVQAAARPQTRLHALCALDGLEMLTPAEVLHGLGDPHAGVRRHALRLSEPWLDMQEELLPAVLQLAGDEEPQVQLQLACSLGASRDPRAAEKLVELAVRFEADAWMSAALFSSVHRDNIGPIVDALAQRPDTISDALLGRLLRVASGLQRASALRPLLAARLQAVETVTGPQSQLAAALWETIGRQEHAAEDFGPDVLQALQRISAASRRLAGDAQTPLEQRLAAVPLLGHDPGMLEHDRAELTRLLLPQHPPALQTAALQRLGRLQDAETAESLVQSWRSFTPAVKSQVLGLLLGRPAWLDRLFDGLQRGAIPVADIDAPRKQRLLTEPDRKIRERAERVFATSANADREKVVQDYRAAAQLPGDASRGRLHFAKQCAACHRLNELGAEVGPDLAALANKSSESLLINILDPSREMDSRYAVYSATTKDGRVLTGILASESANSITLKGPEGKQETLLRDDLDDLQGLGKSLMPDGLERELSPQGVADILAFIRAHVSSRKVFAGNQPATVRAERGQYALRAKEAEIYGREIMFEEPFQNIGLWHDAQDHVSWSLEVAQGGEFDVYLDLACADAVAGNLLVLECGSSQVTLAVPGTGGWDQYRLQKGGRLKLAGGRERLRVRPQGPQVQGALVDLRTVYLVPAGSDLLLAQAPAGPPADAAATARKLLDESVPASERQALITAHPGQAPDVLRELVADLKPGSPEEYRRIPWIWRVAIDAGKRNDPQVLRELLDRSLPAAGEALRDWQAVVIGGGLINGVSQAGHWPGPRLREVASRQEGLATRLARAIDLAAAMADDEQVPPGTRYDALRMLGMESWKQRGAQLTKYLPPEVPAELQMGAVSGIADIDEPESAAALIQALPQLAPGNRELALQALLRTPERRAALRAAVEGGKLARDLLSDKQWEQLRGTP